MVVSTKVAKARLLNEVAALTDRNDYFSFPFAGASAKQSQKVTNS
jgi:hypothetical protein